MLFLNGKNALRLNGLPVLNEKAYDFLDASPLMPEAMRRGGNSIQHSSPKLGRGGLQAGGVCQRENRNCTL